MISSKIRDYVRDYACTAAQGVIPAMVAIGACVSGSQINYLTKMYQALRNSGYKRITIEKWKHVPAGHKIPVGRGSNKYKKAPSNPGTYTMYMVMDVYAKDIIGYTWELE